MLGAILPGGRAAASSFCDAEESPGSMKQGWRVTPAGGDPRESATENRPPHRSNPAARVKRCGKSAPRAPVTAAARQTPPGARPNRGDAPDIRQACFKPRIDKILRSPGWLLERRSNASPRGMAARADTVCSYRYRQHDRTRLTGPLAPVSGRTRRRYSVF